jgi:hypothetical protein
MRHITVPRFGEALCNGAIEELVTTVSSVESGGGHRSLPILGRAPPSATKTSWRCTGCGHQWEQEPLPEEAL